MQVTVTIQQDRAIMSLSGRFDFNSHRDFRNGYDELLRNDAIKVIEIDLGGVDYLDSSALGMLLLLRERAGGAQKALELTHCHDMVQQVLEVANFGKIFTIR